MSINFDMMTDKTVIVSALGDIIETARELDADETGAAFERATNIILTPKLGRH